MPEIVDVNIERETVNDESVRILAWKVVSGSTVEKDQLICEAETSKAVMEICAPAAGVLIQEAVVGEEVPIGARIGRIAPAGALPMTRGSVEHAAADATHTNRKVARLSAVARMAAAEYGIDVATFEPGTLIRRDDVLRKAGMNPDRPNARPLAELSGMAPTASAGVDWSDLPRRKLAESKVLAIGHNRPLASSVTAVCRAPLLRARGTSLDVPYVGVDALIVFETARLLRRYPAFNAVCDHDQMGVYRDVNVGWAIDQGQKLLVPVIVHADQKGLGEIASEMGAQFEAYVSDSLTTATLAGCTFTVSNLTAQSVSVFTPLISQGQSAILGIGSDVSRLEGETFYLTLVFDHRIAEGRTAARFVRELGDRLAVHSELMVGAEVDEPFCVICQRSASILAKVRAVLLKSESPSGLVCSLCVAGLV